MRRFTVIIAALVLGGLIPASVFAGNKLALTDDEMDQISAAAAGPVFGLDAFLLANPSVRQFGFTNSGNVQVKINGQVAPIESRPTPTGSDGFQAFAMVTKTTSLGSQPGLPGLGLIQTSNTSFIGLKPSAFPGAPAPK